MIVDVDCDDGTTQIARTIFENPESYVIQFLEKGKYNLYNFARVEEEIAKDSVSGFYDVEELEDTELFAKHPQGYELIDDSEDEDFECSDEDESSESEDESLVDEDEDEA